MVALLAACVIGRHALRTDPGLRKAIGALLFCSIAGITTSYIRQPFFVWPIAFAMMAAMLYLVYTMQLESKRKRTLVHRTW